MTQSRSKWPDRAQLYFECEALDRTVAALKAKGLVFDHDPTAMFHLWREARLRDPDGHELRLYDPGEKRSTGIGQWHPSRVSGREDRPPRRSGGE